MADASSKDLRHGLLVFLLFVSLLLCVKLALQHDPRGRLVHACSTCRGQEQITHRVSSVHEWPTEDSSSNSSHFRGRRVAAESLNGLVLILPRCGKVARSFWDSGPMCPKCKSLEEGRRMIARAVARNFLPLVISKDSEQQASVSSPTPRACWEASNTGDRALVARAVESWRQRNHVPRSVPTFVIGMGLTSVLASELPYVMHVDAISTEGSPVSEKSMSKGAVKGRSSYPPIAFGEIRGSNLVVKPRSMISEKVSLLHHSPDEDSVKKHSKAPRIRPVDLDYFSVRRKELSHAKSAAAVQALKTYGLLDRQGFLLRNPSREPWQAYLASKGMLNEIALEAVDQELSRAWQSHVQKLDFMEASLVFFSSTSRPAKTETINHRGTS